MADEVTGNSAALRGRARCAPARVLARRGWGRSLTLQPAKKFAADNHYDSYDRIEFALGAKQHLRLRSGARRSRWRSHLKSTGDLTPETCLYTNMPFTRPMSDRCCGLFSTGDSSANSAKSSRWRLPQFPRRLYSYLNEKIAFAVSVEHWHAFVPDANEVPDCVPSGTFSLCSPSSVRKP